MTTLSQKMSRIMCIGLAVNMLILVAARYMGSERFGTTATIVLDAAMLLSLVVCLIASSRPYMTILGLAMSTLIFVFASVMAARQFAAGPTAGSYFLLAMSFLVTIFSGGFLIGTIGNMQESSVKRRESHASAN